ncbi:alpha/beta hydrolase [Hymenobacter sp. RP-2-7]|uniref:Alpha/beta hydrolase n=1 Tax=Hymenobacter polaris TaxID=2682546 RepID=A0A7Y0FM15_9BACT|nr:alpha/beta hydrolase [Hymenobacter polaris]NML65011.1 alpha/beta hydrolase [Hymenobacter polaris]
MPTTHFIDTEVLHLEYQQNGPADAPAALLLHGFPDDYHTWDAVSAQLVAAGYQTIAPSMRGCAGSVFRAASTLRSGQTTALAQDAIDLLDALGLAKVTLVGHDWGARAGYLVAALWPERVEKLVVASVGYETGIKPGDEILPQQVHAYWYQWFFHSERGHEMLQNNRRDFCRYIWHLWAPTWQFGDAEFAQAAASWDNPDWVAVVLHSYRVRWGAAPPDPRYAALEAQLTPQPTISVPTILLHGELDGAALVASSEGKEQYFSGPYERRVLPGVGHYVPREAPEAIVASVLGN